MQRESLHAILIFPVLRPPPLTSHSIRPNRRRIVQQKIPRTTQRVIRIRRLSDRRTRIEVVILIATRTAAAERTAAATNARPAATITAAATWAHTIRLTVATVVLAIALVPVLISERMLMPIAAPVRRTAWRAIIRCVRITGPAVRAMVSIEHTAIATRATCLQVAIRAGAAPC